MKKIKFVLPVGAASPTETVALSIAASHPG